MRKKKTDLEQQVSDLEHELKYAKMSIGALKDSTRRNSDKIQALLTHLELATWNQDNLVCKPIKKNNAD